MRISARQRHLWLWSALAGLCLVLAACGSSAKTSPYTSPQLIQKASTNFAQDSALHFTLTATNIAPGDFAVTQAHGDVVRPDKIEIHGIDEITSGVTAGIGIIIIGSNQYVSFGDTGTYKATNQLPDLLAIFSPSQGIGAILSQMQNPSSPVDDTVNGVDCWRITGTVSSTLLAPITGNPPATPTNVKTTLWIDQNDYQFNQVVLDGVAATGDTPNTTRTFVLSRYNETVTITAPPTQ
jgi:lipoprotein LprG